MTEPVFCISSGDIPWRAVGAEGEPDLACAIGPHGGFPRFQGGCARHYRDAQYLLTGRRWPNADHLAGVAPECRLKAILLGYLDGSMSSSHSAATHIEPAFLPCLILVDEKTGS